MTNKNPIGYDSSYPRNSQDPIGQIVDRLKKNIVDGSFGYAQHDFAALKYALRKDGLNGKSVRHARNSLATLSKDYSENAAKLRSGERGPRDKVERGREAKAYERSANLAAYYAANLPGPRKDKRAGKKKPTYLSDIDSEAEIPHSYNVANVVGEIIQADAQDPLMKALVSRLSLEGDFVFTVSEQDLRQSFDIMSRAVQEKGFDPESVADLFIQADADHVTLDILLNNK